MSTLMLSSAEKPGLNIDIYRQYLQKFEKPLSHVSNPARVTSFFDNLLYIYHFEVGDRRTNSSSSPAQYTVGLNEMSDWTDSEIESRFPLSSQSGFSPLSTQSPISSSIDSHRKPTDDERNYGSEIGSDESPVNQNQNNEYKQKSDRNHEALIQIADVNSHTRKTVTANTTNNNNITRSLSLSQYAIKSISNIAPLTMAPTDESLDGVNWASTSNPKGASVLSAVRNQVSVRKS